MNVILNLLSAVCLMQLCCYGSVTDQFSDGRDPAEFPGTALHLTIRKLCNRKYSERQIKSFIS